ncbi:unnamed protein product [Lymnaea stagnalis]|uniref:ER-bound oxygenase mpaB/mpaB'/Rubber oxygenase catalytic domain-containing protein n=1 Tax=Lymnaea stagnalis TaxID=6523 RepID=A0AAV2HZK8_LYMST
MMDVKDLEDGKNLDGDNEDILDLKPPDDFDMLKFVRGRRFFQSHIFSCSIAMLWSLLCGMCVPELLQALVFTGESDSPKKAFKRYLKTFYHVASWHYGDVWQNGSTSQKSIIDVRSMHRNVRRQMEKKLPSSSQKALSQYHMGMVQSAFMAAIITYPEKMGVRCTTSDLDDYAYFWYGIGHLLGIKRHNNICAHGFPQTLRFCEQIEDRIVNVHLTNPPQQYLKMANAVVIAFQLGKGAFRIIPLSLPLVFKMCFEQYNFLPLAFGDYIRYIIWKLIFFMIKHCSWFKNYLNYRLEKAFKLNFNEM